MSDRYYRMHVRSRRRPSLLRRALVALAWAAVVVLFVWLALVYGFTA